MRLLVARKDCIIPGRRLGSGFVAVEEFGVDLAAAYVHIYTAMLWRIASQWQYSSGYTAREGCCGQTGAQNRPTDSVLFAINGIIAGPQKKLLGHR